MKRLTAILLTLFMLAGCIAAIPVSADEGILTGAYTFMDTCYSPELDIYVALAKDMTNAYVNPKNAPGRIYYSEDGKNWIAAAGGSGDFTQFQSSDTRQNLVWWKEQGVFVATVNNKLKISHDGITWESNDGAWWDKDNSNLRTRSNTSLATNGRQLIAVTGSVIRTYDSINEQFSAYQVGSGLAMSGAGVSNDDVPMYLGLAQNYYRIVDGAEPPSTSVKNTVINETKQHEIVEVVYSDNIGGWLVLNLSDTLHMVSKSGSGCRDLKNIPLSDGTTNTAALSAAEVNGDTIILGTADGKLFTAPNTAESLSGADVWTLVDRGDETAAITEEIRSVSKVDENTFFAASEHKLYYILRDDNGWRYHDSSIVNITPVFSEGSSRIEIPESGIFETYITVNLTTWAGKTVSSSIKSADVVGSLPSGVSAEKNGDRIKLTVSAGTEGAHTVEIDITEDGGQSKRIELLIVDEEGVEIAGFDELLLPGSGEQGGSYEYTARVIGTDGEPMLTHIPRLEADEASVPSGVRFVKNTDGASGNVVISAGASGGKLILRAASAVNPSLKAEKEVSVNERRTASVEVVSGAEQIEIPEKGTISEQYTGVAYDQVHNEVKEAGLVWSVDSKEGVSINSATGLLSIDSSAYDGEITVRASAAANPEIYGEYTVSLTYTEARKLDEDINAVVADENSPVEDNLAMTARGKYGTVLSYVISDESLIKPDGTVIRPSRADKAVTLTVTGKLGKTEKTKVYNLTVKKADTLCTNGNFADGTYDGWGVRNATTVEMQTDGDNNRLKVAGAGVYQTLELANDSSYGFEAYVSADAGSTITISSMKAGTLATITANGSAQVVKANYDYRKQTDSFSDRIYLSCSGVMYISELKAYEITLEYNKAAEAVNKAEYSKTESDISAAKKILDDFYDLPAKQEFTSRLNAIKPATGNNTPIQGPTGGGGFGGGGGSKAPSAASGGTSLIPQPKKTEDNYADELDTYLLNFKDMKEHWAREDVEYMADLKLVNGREDGVFMPDDNVSRAEFAALITRTMGLSEIAYENSFFDVTDEDWYSGYVQTVKTNGFMNGYDGLFNPEASITREEIAKVIVEAYNSKSGRKTESGGALYFSDLADISFWAYDYITDAVNLGFMNGISEEIFAPKDNATRAQAAVMLRRLYDKLNLTEQNTEEQ